MYDVRTAAQIIGSLFNNPNLLAETDSYNITPEDFIDRIHKICFVTIYNLYHDGMEKMNLTDILSHLAKMPELNLSFEQGEGAEFLATASEIAELSNFKYHYKRLKKFSLLRDLKACNYDISPFYIEPGRIVEASVRTEAEQRFNDLTVQEILSSYSVGLLDIESKFINRKNFSMSSAADELQVLKEELKESPEFGFALEGDMLTTAVRGARRAKFYLLSANSSGGKSRTAVGNACKLAFPYYYCLDSYKWKENGNVKKILFITTELEASEIKTMIIAYLSGVNEDKILTGRYTGDEEERVDQAIKLVMHYADNFIIYHMPDPGVAQLNTNIRRIAITKKIDAVFFDYIHTSPSLYAEFMNVKRDDLLLLMMSSALKNLANELNIFIWSGTQLNGNKEKEGEFSSASHIRGSRSIIDKADMASIAEKTTPTVLATVKHLLAKYPTATPNVYVDIFKNRRSQFNGVRIWRVQDLGICRAKDLFITNQYGEELDMETIYVKHGELVPAIEDILGADFDKKLLSQTHKSIVESVIPQDIPWEGFEIKTESVPTKIASAKEIIDSTPVATQTTSTKFKSKFTV